MAGYTITITPFDDETAPETTIRVDTSSGQARIVELSVRAPGGSGLSAGHLPAVNLDQMIAAIGPAQQPALVTTPAAGASRQRRAPAGRRTAKAARAKAAAPTASRSRQARAAKAAEQPARAGRAYRRMPEADDVVAAYRRTGSTTAVAEHYGVPRHTATGWVRRLRRLGLLETPRRR